MSGLTYAEISVDRTQVENRLDEPAKAFLKDGTIDTLLGASYRWIFNQIDINADNKDLVKDAIYDMSTWRAFVAYGEAVSEQLQLQSLIAFQTKVKSLKEIAQMTLSLLNLTLDKKVVEDSYEVVVAGMGASMLDGESEAEIDDIFG